MQSQTFSSTLLGIDAHLVRVEVAVSMGLPGLVVVGLPDAAVSEAGARVRSAVRASGFDWPPRRVVVNLSPADLRKQGAGFDLALALAVLEALEEVPAGRLSRTLILGELSLDGSVRAVKGVVPALSLAAQHPEIDRVVLSAEQPEQEFCLPSLSVVAVRSLREAVEILRGERQAEPWTTDRPAAAAPRATDLREVRGQGLARWALEIAAAGGHHLMMVGPPGCGKSLLASCLPGILPPMTPQEGFEVASVASVLQEPSAWGVRPFRAPGQGTSAVALLGGQQPGEVTRAHHGVLFLDEFPEFRRDALEALRQVLESGSVSVVRARFRITYPARFTLVAAMNPCPCGLAGGGPTACHCSEVERTRYAGKLSGPLRDRFDLLVALERQPLEALWEPGAGFPESSAEVAVRVAAARQRQEARGVLNRDLRGRQLHQSLGLRAGDQAFCAQLGERWGLSMRGLEKWLRVARTVADLQASPLVERSHLMAALTVRAPQAARSGAA